MKIEYLPEKQEANNKRINRAVRFLLTILVVLIVCPVLSGAWLYFNGPAAPPPPQIIGPDKSSVLGDAVVLTPNFVLCQGDCPDGSLLALGHDDPIPLSKVRSEDLHSGVAVTLLRTTTTIPDELVHPLSDIESGEQVFSNSSQGAWKGTIVTSTTGLSLEPTPGALSFLPIYSKSDLGLVGIAASTKAGFEVIPMREISAKFPEIER